MGDAPASGGGGGLAQSFRQPVTTTTQTQSGGGGGILGLLGPALSIGKFFLAADGGSIPRGRFDDGGTASNNGQPMRLITLAVPDLSKSYIPQTQAPARTMGPPTPPQAPPQGAGVGNPLSDALSTLKSSEGLSKLFKGNDSGGNGGASLGGAVEPRPIPLQYDYGGVVPPQATGAGLPCCMRATIC